MVDVDDSSLRDDRGLTTQVEWLGLRIDRRLALFYIHQMNVGELWQFTCHDDSTINIV